MRKYFTVVFFLFFAFMFTFLLLLGELNFYVMTPAFIKSPLRETQAYQKLANNSDVITEQLKEKAITSEPVDRMPESAQKLSQVMLKSVDDAWLEKGVDRLYEYIISDQQDRKISFDMRGYKANLRTNLNELMLEEYNRLPEVAIEQFEEQLAKNPGGFPTSRPAGYTMEQMLAKTGHDPVNEILNKIPDDYSPNTMDGLTGLRQIAAYLGILNMVFWALTMTTVILLLLFAKITSMSLVEFIMRLGVFLSAALVPLLLFTVLWYISVNIIMVEGLAKLDFSTTVVKQIIEPIVRYGTSRVFAHLVAWSGAISALGLAIAIPAGKSLRPKSANQKKSKHSHSQLAFRLNR